MKCLVFSDSHGCSQYMEKALSLHPDTEVVFFLGDGIYEAELLSRHYPAVAWISVRGNCDRYSDPFSYPIKKTERINLCAFNIVLTHGDLYGAKMGYGGLLHLAGEKNADILLFGHTHCPEYKYFDEADGARTKPLHLFNPGSISASSGSYGILILDKKPSFSHGNLLAT